jgi:hypothetical protein
VPMRGSMGSFLGSAVGWGPDDPPGGSFPAHYSLAFPYRSALAVSDDVRAVPSIRPGTNPPPAGFIHAPGVALDLFSSEPSWLRCLPVSGAAGGRPAQAAIQRPALPFCPRPHGRDPGRTRIHTSASISPSAKTTPVASGPSLSIAAV